MADFLQDVISIKNSTDVGDDGRNVGGGVCVFVLFLLVSGGCVCLFFLLVSSACCLVGLVNSKSRAN